MKLCSIDSSTSATGMALFVDGNYKKHVLFDYHKNKDVEERINLMIHSIIKQLQEWNPNIVWIEQPKGSGRNVEMVRKLSEILGGVRCWCICKNQEYHEIMPSQWRKWLPGYEQGGKDRKELKEESVKYAKKILNIDLTNDEADAVNIGLGVLEYYKSLS